jgi:hypothetical protein
MPESFFTVISPISRPLRFLPPLITCIHMHSDVLVCYSCVLSSFVKGKGYYTFLFVHHSMCGLSRTINLSCARGEIFSRHGNANCKARNELQYYIPVMANPRRLRGIISARIRYKQIKRAWCSSANAKSFITIDSLHQSLKSGTLAPPRTAPHALRLWMWILYQYCPRVQYGCDCSRTPISRQQGTPVL